MQLKNITIKFLISFIFILASQNAFSQKDTTLVTNKKDSIFVKGYEINPHDTTSIKKNPKLAAWLSFSFPGLGQAYNNKYWKIPLVYGAIGGALFWADNNNKNYKRFSDAYHSFTDNDSTTIDEFEGKISADNLLFYKNKYRRNRDLSLILAFTFWALQIVDASVDAHLSDYDISEDLSLHIEPVILPIVKQNNAFGVKLSMRF